MHGVVLPLDHRHCLVVLRQPPLDQPRRRREAQALVEVPLDCGLAKLGLHVSPASTAAFLIIAANPWDSEHPTGATPTFTKCCRGSSSIRARVDALLGPLLCIPRRHVATTLLLSSATSDGPYGPHRRRPQPGLGLKPSSR